MASNTFRQAVITAALVLMVASGSRVSAQMVVNDPPHQIQNILTQLKDMAAKASKYSKDYAHYAAQIQHYQQQLIKVKGMLSMVQLPGGVPVQTVNEDSFLVAEECGIDGGFSLQALGSAIGINAAGNLIQQQKDICATIRRMRNKKHNETVEYLHQTLGQIEKEVKQLAAQRNASSDKGAIDANDNDTLRHGVTADITIEQWRTRMAVYDTYIASLESQQAALAKSALRGKKTTIGTVVKTAALKAALEL